MDLDEATAHPPEDWQPPAPGAELSDPRTEVPEGVAGPVVPFEPRVVPEQGMPAWRTPAGDAAPETQLAGGTELLVIERAGAWARVLGEHGWIGWVDDRPLVDPDLPHEPASQPVATSEDWTATHQVPAAELATYSSPTPADELASRLAPGLGVELIGTFGPWSHVRCDNGWECWVDGRLLIAVDGS